MSVTQIKLSSAYSMGKQKREAFFVNDKRNAHVPGPNNYTAIKPDQTSRANKRPSWSCGKETRFKNYAKPTPGPGSYTIPSKGTEGFKFTTSSKPNINSELSAHGITASPFKMRTEPGPGNYEPPVSGAFKKLSYSISGVNDKFVKGTDSSWPQPGPGQYDNCID
jgi:hypothetical protein